MIKAYTILLTVGLSINVFAQKTKYKDIYPLVANSVSDAALFRLKSYIAEDLNHPHANFKMALIYESRYKNADVLTEYEKALANADRAKLRFIKSQSVVNEKEVSRNVGYYSDFSTGFDSRGRPQVSFLQISNKMKNGYDSSVMFVSKIPAIYQSFTKSVINYDRAVKIFSEINNRYGSMDELYLLYDNELSAKLTRLKLHYDSTLTYFDKYKTLIAEYPINDYDQKYIIEPIITYRLHGLITHSNFLSNEVKLWNYGQWVDDIRQMIETNIKTLRSAINEGEEAINKQLQNGAITDDSILKLDKQFLFNLNKFDYQSLAGAVLDYKYYKQNVTIKRRSKTYYDTARNIAKQRKYVFYSDMINITRFADSLISRIELRNIEKKRNRHKEYLAKYYSGEKGLSKFIEEEKKNNSKEFRYYIQSLRSSILDDLVGDTLDNSKTIRYKRMSIPMTATPLQQETLDVTAPQTTQSKKNTDGSYYLAGIYRSASANSTVAFITHLSEDKKIKWFKTYDIQIDSAGSDAHTFPTTIALTQEGCIVVLRSKHKSRDQYLNTLIYLAESGEVKLTKHLEVTTFPRKILYNELANSMLICYKGAFPDQRIKQDEVMTLSNFNVLGDPMWSQTIEMAGSVEDLIQTKNGYLVLGNFTAMKNNNGKMTKLKVNIGQSNAFAVTISTSGQVAGTLLISSPNTYFVSDIVKVNDGNINCFGYKKTYEPLINRIENTENLAHIIINADLEIISSNVND